MTEMQEFALKANAWPFQEARRLLKQRLKGKTPEKGYVLFETGYGPSGLPHIGTFGEIVRTTMVRNAFEVMAPEIPTRLFCFSDDMDGLRKVPDNIPNRELIAEHIGKPLSSIPDPFETHESYGHHNNARLMQFLDSFGFEYEFRSSTECYTSGLFDKMLLEVLRRYDDIVNVILPTLGSERRSTYSPFLPVSGKTGRILQAPVIERDTDAGTIVYEEVDGTKVETPVTGGHCKLQWKCDWAMRWAALAVDYEMSGKDLIDSVKLSSRICKILDSNPPVNLTYELFLDEKGEKISKSKGNGLAVEDWLKYAPQESLAFFMYQKPNTAKRLYFDIIPRNVDDYLTQIRSFASQDGKKRLNNPVWHIHKGNPPEAEAGIPFNIILNLVSVCHSDDPSAIWHYITRYVPEATPENSPILDKLVGFAISFYQDFVLPEKHYRKATIQEKSALEDLRETLTAIPGGASSEDVQTQVYEVGKRHECFDNLKAWFKALYQILLGQDSGPRMGSFIVLYGIKETIELLDRVIAGEDLAGLMIDDC